VIQLWCLEGVWFLLENFFSKDYISTWWNIGIFIIFFSLRYSFMEMTRPQWHTDGDGKKFGRQSCDDWKFSIDANLIIEICFWSRIITKVVEYDQGFSYVSLDGHDEHVRTDVYVMPDTKWCITLILTTLHNIRQVQHFIVIS
jgi:hypothetical protein